MTVVIASPMPGNKPDQRVEAEPDLGSRHDERCVHQGRERIEARDALLAGEGGAKSRTRSPMGNRVA